VREERLHALIRTLYAVGGGALAVSMAIFLRSESLELGPDLVGALQVAWLSLFYALGACAVVQVTRLFYAESRVRSLIARLVGATAFLAFLLGLVMLAYVSAVAIGEANSPDTTQETDTSAV
jgi:hypothetical protein